MLGWLLENPLVILLIGGVLWVILRKPPSADFVPYQHTVPSLDENLPSSVYLDFTAMLAHALRSAEEIASFLGSEFEVRSSEKRISLAALIVAAYQWNFRRSLKLNPTDSDALSDTLEAWALDPERPLDEDQEWDFLELTDEYHDEWPEFVHAVARGLSARAAWPGAAVAASDVSENSAWMDCHSRAAELLLARLEGFDPVAVR